jgi:hypothetical protein
MSLPDVLLVELMSTVAEAPMIGVTISGHANSARQSKAPQTRNLEDAMPDAFAAAQGVDRLRCYGRRPTRFRHDPIRHVIGKSALRPLAKPVLSLAEGERTYAPRA